MMVAVGGSAGGLAAFVELLTSIPPTPGFPIIFVAHLGARQGRGVVEMLQRATLMPVRLLQTGTRPAPNEVYVVPPGRVATFRQNMLTVRTANARDKPPRSIDVTFQSIATEPAHFPVGVLLSGTLSDGSAGLAAIRAEGGVSLAQDPATAKFAMMPKAAISAGVVDIVGSAAKIATELVRMSRRAASRLPANAPISARPEFHAILDVLQSSHGVDFRAYKAQTIQRRLLRRLTILGLKTLRSYLARFRKDASEQEALYQDFLISVTAFFRQPETYSRLRKTVFPRLVYGREEKRPIRIWVPGCSTGEEAYSIAMVAQEYMEELGADHSFQLFATDVSNRNLGQARAGIYPSSIEGAVSAERLSRFFVKRHDGYQVSAAIRNRCVFAAHNLLSDPPFSRMDLISCRNVLIYLGPDAQRTVIGTFHYALLPGGYLVLGSAESIYSLSNLFVPADRVHRIYRRRDVATPPLEGTDRFRLPAPQVESPREPLIPVDGTITEVEQLLAKLYAPAAVLIHDNFQVERFHGDAQDYLKIRAGAPTANLLQLANARLVVPLRALLVQATKTGKPAVRSGLRMGEGRRRRWFSLKVYPFADSQRGSRRFLVVFEPEEAWTPSKTRGRKTGAPGMTPRSTQARVDTLEAELREARDFLRASLDEQHAIQDQLRVATEELESRNEELQSMNEELQTAKEELQSTNEELVSTNDQLNSRNLELAKANADLANLVDGANLPLIMLDRDMKIRRFSQAAGSAMNILPSDIGRPLSHLNVDIPMAEVAAAHKKAVSSGRETEIRVRNQTGKEFTLRLTPYQDQDSRHIDGAVLSLRRVVDNS